MVKRFRVNVWYQIDGDVNPAQYGATIAREDSYGRIEVIQIQPTTEYVGNDAYSDGIGFPFWSREASYDLDNLRHTLTDDGKGVLSSIGACADDFDLSKRGDRLALASAMLSYGVAVYEGPAGWSSDVLCRRRVSWWTKGGFGGRAADAEFHRNMKEARS